MGSYNASVIRVGKDTGEEIGCFVAEVDGEGKMLRSNSVQCTAKDGTPAYDAMMRRMYPSHAFQIHRDGCRRYRQRLASLALPAAYRRGCCGDDDPETVDLSNLAAAEE